MKKIEIFDPAMCCPTGLCGTNINPELMRIAVVIETPRDTPCACCSSPPHGAPLSVRAHTVPLA